MSVSPLPSSRNLTARENLRALVDRARNQVASFGSDLDYDAHVWDVSHVQDVRASAGHATAKLYFTTHDGGGNPSMEGRTPLAEGFGHFLKALVRLREEAGHVSAGVHRVTIRAGRYLYDATASCGHDPCSLLPEHFLAAATACKEREEPSSAYRVGQALMGIAGSVNRYNVARVRIDFANPFRRVTYDDTRIGREAETRRADRLVSPAALDALAAISNLVEEPADVLRMRCVELLVCGGWRINELLTIRAECEVFEKATENGNPVLDDGGEQIIRYGISYFAEKDGGPRIKWIPTEMVGIAKRAIADIRRITQPSRDVLAWMAENPGRARLPGSWNERAASRFSMSEIRSMFGLGDATSALVFARALGVRQSGERQARIVERRDLEEALLARQNTGDSTSGPLPTRNNLFLAPQNFFHRGRAEISSIVVAISDQQISDFIKGREGVGTVFARFGFANEDGSPITVTTHQFRHWLNTLQQRGGMSQMEIARWSGRKDMGQNAAYDHRSGVEMAAVAREMMAAGKVHGSVSKLHDRLPPVHREAFRDAVFTTAHKTDLGMCANDYSLVPCTEHGGCAGCSEHLVIKGDVAQRARAERLLGEKGALLAHAEAEANEGTYGASNHVAHLRRSCDALTGMLAVHADCTIDDGNLVHVDLATGHRRGQLLGQGKAA